MRSLILLVALTLPAAAQQGVPFRTGDPISLVRLSVQTRTLKDGTHITTTSREYVYRDSAAHIRDETLMPMQYAGQQTTSRIVSVTDMPSRSYVMWQTFEGFSPAKVYTRRTMQEAPQTSLPSASAQVTSAAAKTSREKLGSDNVQGIPCEVWRYSTTYPAGKYGNDRDYTNIREVCTSVEFGSLRESSESPVSGTRTTTLESLTRGEPDPALFQPPPDYTESGQH